MKKYMRIAAVLLILCTGFICLGYFYLSSGKETENNEKQQLHIWGNQQFKNGFDKIAGNFCRQYPQAEIVYHQYQGNNMTANLKLETDLLAGGNDVDVYFTYTTQELSKRVEAGLALNLGDLCRRDGFNMEENFTEDIKKFYYHGAPYSVPSTVGKMGIILNKDMFEAESVEIPKDWDFEEFREVCRKLTKGEGKEKVYGIFWNTQDNVSEALLHLVLPTLGGDPLYNQAGTASDLNNEIIVKALELMYDTMKTDKTAPNHENSEIRNLSMYEMFFEERCAMTVGAWLFTGAVDSEMYPHDFETAFAPWPVENKEERAYTQGSFGNHLSINPKSDNIDLAWEFIKWYTTKGIKENISLGYTPCYTGFSRSEIEAELFKNTGQMMDKDSAMRVLMNPDKNLSIPVIENKIDKVTEIFDNAVEKVLLGKEEARQALNSAKLQADMLLKAD